MISPPDVAHTRVSPGYHKISCKLSLLSKFDASRRTKMSSTNIFQLNEYCLIEILKYIPVYDHGHFANVCTRFRQIVIDWSSTLYQVFEIRDESQLSFFAIVCEHVKNLYIHIQGIEYKLCGRTSTEEMFIKNVSSMAALEKITLRTSNFQKNYGGFTNLQYQFLSALDSERIKLLQKLLIALKDLSNLKKIKIIDGVGREFLEESFQCMNIEKFVLHLNIRSEVLIDLCKSHPKLRDLKVKKLFGYISDMIPLWQNLEVLGLSTFADEYEPLAELPNLKKLLLWPNRTHSLVHLFNRLALKEPQQLSSLTINRMIDFDQTKGLVRIKSLKELQCQLSNAKCVELLTQLTELESLSIGFVDSGECYPSILSVLQSCTKLRDLTIRKERATRNFIFDVFKVLQRVRDPKLQQPLKLKCHLGTHFDKEICKPFCAHLTLINLITYR